MSDRDNPENLTPPLKHAEDIVPREIAGETILVPVRGELAEMQQIFVLDEVARFIWERLDGDRSVDDLVEGLVERFEVDAQTARADLVAFLSELEEAGLVVTNE